MLRPGQIISTAAAVSIAGLPAPTEAQTTHTVELAIVDFTPAFTPANITIIEGDTVHWVWIIGFHNVESGVVVLGAGVHDGNFRSGLPTGVVGTTFDLVFDAAFLDAHPAPNNVYPYFCSVHDFLNMVGTVSVVRQGDLNHDGRINLDDHAVIASCMSGPGTAAAPVGCTVERFTFSDTDKDGDVDLKDFAAFQPLPAQ